MNLKNKLVFIVETANLEKEYDDLYSISESILLYASEDIVEICESINDLSDNEFDSIFSEDVFDKLKKVKKQAGALIRNKKIPLAKQVQYWLGKLQKMANASPQVFNAVKTKMTQIKPVKQDKQGGQQQGKPQQQGGQQQGGQQQGGQQQGGQQQGKPQQQGVNKTLKNKYEL